VLLGGQIVDPGQFGLDVVFPAAMIGLAVGLMSGRREVVAAATGAVVGVIVALLTSGAIGIAVGGIVGPFAGLLVPSRASHETAPLGTPASAERYAMPGMHAVGSGSVDAARPPEEPPS